MFTIKNKKNYPAEKMLSAKEMERYHRFLAKNDSYALQKKGQNQFNTILSFFGGVRNTYRIYNTML
ncbi:hypothetical protein MASR1M74_18820 [Lentimicrobium sp.]